MAVEIERKYVLAAAPPADVLAAGTAYAIEQTYLTSTCGARRVRRRTGPDGVRHWLNEKHRIGGISREEIEREVSEDEYRQLLAEADPRWRGGSAPRPARRTSRGGRRAAPRRSTPPPTRTP